MKRREFLTVPVKSLGGLLLYTLAGEPVRLPAAENGKVRIPLLFFTEAEARAVQAAHAKGLIVDAVLIGVDLGPNLSITGSLATILWLIALRKEKLDVSFWDFLKVGAVAMPIALLASLGGAILMHLCLRMS